ncbi:uncharacterized protein PRCAT00003301001 [Priceomyces carsonii]|uniref:uncharacterized protein n=1 Tax=Priceomyces carsonii TaxID=28549 RepID=UPI002ED8F57B|nr:unnamed protein product [Priceomyces carsonii]
MKSGELYLKREEPSKPRNKREYSKGGCRECKRRKIKCSEEKPQCWQCKRLDKECSYPEVGERVPRVSKKLLEIQPIVTEIKEQKPFTIQQYSPKSNGKKIKKHRNSSSSSKHSSTSSSPVLNENKSDSSAASTHVSELSHPSTLKNKNSISFPPRYTPSSIVNLLNDSNVPIAPDNGSLAKQRISTAPSPINPHRPVIPPISAQGFQSPQVPIYQSQNSPDLSQVPRPLGTNGLLMNSDYQFYNRDDLNVLASDLNNLVNNIMFESTDSKLHEMYNFDPSFSSAIDRNEPTFNGSHLPEKVPPREIVLRDIPFDFIPVSNEREKLYLKEFYDDFSNIILPFASYDENLKTYFNPARDILLQCASNESFLLAAILAQGAKIVSHKRNLPQDEEAYVTYLSKCLKLLGPAISTDFGKMEKAKLTSNIEAVLLTVLLLTTANAANIKQDWRPHLRGAKDLLLRNTSSKKQNSKILIFCKFWFVTFEVLASISSKLGGTLKSEAEIDLLVNPGTEYEVEVLKELGIVKSNGFNILGGYHHSSIAAIRDLIKILNKLNSNDMIYEPENCFECLSTLSEFYKQSQIEFINRKCLLTPQDFPDNKVPSGSLLDRVKIKDENYIISWMDCSHQAYTIASILTILVKCLQVPYTSSQVQCLTKTLTHLISFLKDSTEAPQQIFNCSMMMLQWPMFIAALNCIQEEDKLLFLTFFKISSQIGSASASFSLKRVIKVWEHHKNGDTIPDDDDNIDIVAY